MSQNFSYCITCSTKIFENDKHYNIKMCENCVEHQMREKRKDK